MIFFLSNILSLEVLPKTSGTPVIFKRKKGMKKILENLCRETINRKWSVKPSHLVLMYIILVLT